jgi:hypothetical protein
MANLAKLRHFFYCGNAWSTKGRELPARLQHADRRAAQ